MEANGCQGPEEDDANRFAADLLVPPQKYRRIREWTAYSGVRVEAFALECGIAPGIVVGRLQHDGLIPMSHLNGLKLRLEWADQSR